MTHFWLRIAIVWCSLIMGYVVAMPAIVPAVAENAPRYCLQVPNQAQSGTYQVVDPVSQTVQAIIPSPPAANPLSAIANKRFGSTSADGKFRGYFILEDAIKPADGWYIIEPTNQLGPDREEKTIRFPVGDAITSEGIRFDEQNVWSPSGHLLIHLSQQMPNYIDIPTLTVIDPALMTINVLPLPSRTAQYWGVGLIWSADGHFLALLERSEAGERLLVLDVEQLKFSFPPTFYAIPTYAVSTISWSPKGDQLAYVASDANRETWLYLRDVQSDTETKLVQVAVFPDEYFDTGTTFLRWAENGQDLLFIQPGVGKTINLARIDKDTGAVTLVAETLTRVPTDLGNSQNRLLVVSQSADGLLDAGIFNTNGIRVQQLITRFDKVKSINLTVAFDYQHILLAWQHSGSLRLRWIRVGGSQQLDRDIQAEQLESQLIFSDNRTVGLQVRSHDLTSVGTWDTTSNKLYWVGDHLSQAVLQQYWTQIESNTLAAVFVDIHATAYVLSFGPRGHVDYKYPLHGKVQLQTTYGMPTVPSIYEAPNRQAALLLVNYLSSQYASQLASAQQVIELDTSAYFFPGAIAWSPDSQLVAYTTQQTEGKNAITVVTLNGDKIWRQAGFSNMSAFIGWQVCPSS